MTAASPPSEDMSQFARGGSANALAAIIATAAGVFITVLAGRSMSPAEYATFAAIWGLVFGAASVVAALEPETARHHANAPGPIDRTELATMFTVAGAALVVMTGVVLIFSEELRLDSAFISLCIVVSAGMFTSLFVARGYLAGSLRFVPLAFVTVAEATVRLAVVLLGLLLAFPVVPAFAVAALASAMVGLPIVIARSSWTPGIVSFRAALKRTSLLMGGNIASALMITGAPVLVGLAMVESPASAVGRMQSAVVVSRFPLMFLMLVQSLLVPAFARRRSLESTRDYRILVAVLLLLLPVMTALAYLFGPAALRFIYGADYVIGPMTMAFLTLGATALGGIQVLIALAVAADHHLLAVVALPAALAVTLAVAFLSGLPGEVAVPAALSIGPLFGFAIAIAVTFGWNRQARVRTARSR